SARWMSALTDDETGLNTNANCVSLADYSGDGEIKLIVADLGTSRYEMKMKVFKALTKIGETTLIDSAIAIMAFNNEQKPTYTMGVACGNSLFVYRALRPFYKFEIPVTPLLHSEALAWDRYWKDGQQLETLTSNLQLAADE
ncbi:hypothetical protein PFISCL1PPCAC_22431, partial [Pristionchus fissidentatus]